MKKFRQRVMCGLLGDTLDLLGVEIIGIPKLEPAFSSDEILVTKVDTDYRGRKALTAEDGISFSVTSHMPEHGIEKALDGDRSTYWQGKRKTIKKSLLI